MKKSPIERLYHSFTLPNGLHVVHTPSPTPVVYCGYAINAGTRDETTEEQGMAHFVEHLLFKGTEKRKAWHILNRMENVGGDLNAYTNKEETVVYCALLKEHFARAVELLTDIVFHSTFPQTEIEREVEVVIDEIQSYEDSPAELIFDDFEELIFPNHALGRNILGTPEVLRKYNTEDIQHFVKRYYRPENMVFFVWGDLSTAQVERTLCKYASFSCTDKTVIPLRKSPLPYIPTQRIIEKSTNQAHIMIGGRGYSAHDKKRTGLYLLNNILGGPGMNSRLNLTLRERRGLVYNVESNLTPYTDTGIFSIYFGCDHTDSKKCISLVKKELEKLCEAPIKATQLQAAKKQLLGQAAVASDNFENVALAMGKTFLHFGNIEPQSQLKERIEALTAEELHEIATEMFSPTYLSILHYK
ncbi:MAG: insulinase family protein [Phocaeicola sp.]|nr:insulinase family protein [Phocaeicola sp.]MDY3914495.1 pitrilysin family protein [Phocaeicola sp.]